MQYSQEVLSRIHRSTLFFLSIAVCVIYLGCLYLFARLLGGDLGGGFILGSYAIMVSGALICVYVGFVERGVEILLRDDPSSSRKGPSDMSPEVEPSRREGATPGSVVQIIRSAPKAAHDLTVTVATPLRAPLAGRSEGRALGILCRGRLHFWRHVTRSL